MISAVDRTQLSIDQYREEVLQLIRPVADTEDIVVAEALDRVLAERLVSRGPLPGDTNSAMDGYAVRFDDLGGGLPRTLTVVAELPAGSTADPSVDPGQCVRIMTGAPLPRACDTVIPQELTTDIGDEVTIRELPAMGRSAHVRVSGADYALGAPVATPGQSLTPGRIGALSATGHRVVRVFRLPRVAVLSTGSELVTAPRARGRGQVWASNQFQLAAAVQRLGAALSTVAAVDDDPDLLTATLDELSASQDIVIVTGGASVGRYDTTRIVLSEQRQAAFRHVRMQPGKPQGWALWRNRTPVLCLPGNPIASAVSFEMFVRPAVSKLAGGTTRQFPDGLQARSTSSYRVRPGRVQFVPVLLSSSADQQLLATPVHPHRPVSHLLSATADADALAIIDEQVTHVVPGTPVRLVALT